MFKSIIMAAVMVAAALPASAAVMRFEITGKVWGGTDGLNLFAQGAGANLQGQAYTSIFIYDTDHGYDSSFNSPDDEQRLGATNFPTPISPVRSASLEIGRVSVVYEMDFARAVAANADAASGPSAIAESFISYASSSSLFSAMQRIGLVERSGATRSELGYTRLIHRDLTVAVACA
jgi:hypothetical protein